MLARMSRKGNTLGRNIDWYSHYRKQNGDCLGEKNGGGRNLPQDSEILLLSVFLKETKSLSLRDICIPMFAATVFKIDVGNFQSFQNV